MKSSWSGPYRPNRCSIRTGKFRLSKPAALNPRSPTDATCNKITKQEVSILPIANQEICGLEDLSAAERVETQVAEQRVDCGYSVHHFRSITFFAKGLERHIRGTDEE